MDAKRVVFRCSFGEQQGWGHVVRSSALAAAFQEAGWQTVLWSHGPLSALPGDVRSAFSACQSPSAAPSGSILFIDEMYASDLELRSIIRAWQSASPCGVVAGTDDMRRRSMRDFDLVVNPELGLREARYECDRLLLGEDYALLRRGFSGRLSVDRVDLPREAFAVFVMIGGTDAFGIVDRVLEGLADLSGEQRTLPVVALGSSPAPRVLQERFEDFRLLRGLESAELAEWMRRCRLGLIGCGSSAYELAAVGLPFLGICLVDNQRAASRKLRDLWQVPIVEAEKGALSQAAFARELRGLLSAPPKLKVRLDGAGACRVRDELMGLAGARALG